MSMRVGVLTAICCLLLTTPVARAGILLRFNGTTSGPTGVTFDYQVYLTPGSELERPGKHHPVRSSFTLDAIPGLIPGSESLSHLYGFGKFTTQASALGPNLTDLTIDYTGRHDVHVGRRGHLLLLGDFSFLDTLPLATGTLSYSGQTQSDAAPGTGGDRDSDDGDDRGDGDDRCRDRDDGRGDEDDQPGNNDGSVPGPGGQPALAVPEPSTLTLFGIGAVGLTLGAWWRRRGLILKVA